MRLGGDLDAEQGRSGRAAGARKALAGAMAEAATSAMVEARTILD